jgi:hypothetical protein
MLFFAALAQPFNAPIGFSIAYAEQVSWFHISGPESEKEVKQMTKKEEQPKRRTQLASSAIPSPKRIEGGEPDLPQVNWPPEPPPGSEAD